MTGVVLQVNVGSATTVEINGQDVATAIVKTAVDGPVRLHVDHVGGDTQADLDHHGGPWQAVYAFDRATADHFAAELDRDIPNGGFGENLTLSGIDCDTSVVGQQWRVGEAVVAVTGPRIPCKKLGWRMERPRFVKEFLHAERTGSYLRVITEGHVRTGDPVEIVHTPAHGVTIVDVLRMWLGDRSLVDHVLSAGDDLHPVTRERAMALLAN